MGSSRRFQRNQTGSTNNIRPSSVAGLASEDAGTPNSSTSVKSRVQAFERLNQEDTPRSATALGHRPGSRSRNLSSSESCRSPIRSQGRSPLPAIPVVSPDSKRLQKGTKTPMSASSSGSGRKRKKLSDRPGTQSMQASLVHSATMLDEEDEDPEIRDLRTEFVSRNTVKFNKLRDAFRKIDRDKNGILDQDELFDALKYMGVADLQYEVVGRLMRAGIEKARRDRRLQAQEKGLDWTDDVSDEGIDVLAFANFLWPNDKDSQLVPEENKKQGQHSKSRYLFLGKVGSWNDTLALEMRDPTDMGPFPDCNSPSVPWNILHLGKDSALRTERTSKRHQAVLNYKDKFSKHMFKQSEVPHTKAAYDILSNTTPRLERSEEPGHGGTLNIKRQTYSTRSLPQILTTFSRIHTGKAVATPQRINNQVVW